MYKARDSDLFEALWLDWCGLKTEAIELMAEIIEREVSELNEEDKDKT